MAFEFLKNMSKGAKSPSSASGAGQKTGAFLRYMLDEDLRKEKSKQDAQSDFEYPEKMGDLPLTFLSRDSSGKTSASYGYRGREKSSSQGTETVNPFSGNTPKPSPDSGGGVWDSIKNYFGAVKSKISEAQTKQPAQQSQYTIGQTIEKNGKKYKITGFDTDGTPLVDPA